MDDLCLLEVESEVGGEDAPLDNAKGRLVVVLKLTSVYHECWKKSNSQIGKTYVAQIFEDAVPGNVEEEQGLVEVVPFQGGTLVEDGERVLGLQLERVRGPSVVEVVTQARDHQTQTFDLEKMKSEEENYISLPGLRS